MRNDPAAWAADNVCTAKPADVPVPTDPLDRLRGAVTKGDFVLVAKTDLVAALRLADLASAAKLDRWPRWLVALLALRWRSAMS